MSRCIFAFNRILKNHKFHSGFRNNCYHRKAIFLTVLVSVLTGSVSATEREEVAPTQSPPVFFTADYAGLGCHSNLSEAKASFKGWIEGAGGTCNVEWLGAEHSGPAFGSLGTCPDYVPANTSKQGTWFHHKVNYEYSLTANGCDSNALALESNWGFVSEYYEYCEDGFTLQLMAGRGYSCVLDVPEEDDCPNFTSNPVQLGVGNKYLSEVDFKLPAPSDLSLVRYYNHSRSTRGTFGRNWTSSLDYRLEGGVAPAVAYVNVIGKVFLYEEKSFIPGGGMVSTDALAGALVWGVEGKLWRYTPAESGSASVFSPNGKDFLYFIGNDIKEVPSGIKSYPAIIYLRRPNGSSIKFQWAGSVWRSANSPNGYITYSENYLTYITGNGDKEIYNRDGKITQIVKATGYTMDFGYRFDQKVSSVTSNLGERIDVQYNASGQAIQVDDHTGRSWIYSYAGNGMLNGVANSDGSTQTYHYEDSRFPYYLTGVTDERNIRYSIFAYDENGRASLSTLANNVERIDIIYNDENTRTVYSGNANQTVYTTEKRNGVIKTKSISGPGCTACGGSDAGYQYDANNNTIAKTEHGITTQYGDHTIEGKPGFMVEASGTAQERRTDYTYDTLFPTKYATVTKPSVSPGLFTTTTYTYNLAGNRTSTLIEGFKPNGTPVSSLTTYQYAGPFGQISEIDGPRTNLVDKTTFEYYPDDEFEGFNRARLKSITSAGLTLRSNISYTATGQVFSESRPNGLSLMYSYYPGNDRLKSLTETSGTESRTTRWTYLPTGEVETVTRADGTPYSSTITLGYDDARRLIRIEDSEGNYISYEIDAEGNRLGEQIFDSNGVLEKSITQTFDAYNHLDTRLNVDELTDVTIGSDGNLQSSVNPKSVTTQYDYDALQRLTHVLGDFGGTDAMTADTATTYTYDTADRLTKVTAPNTVETGYVYDDLGNLVEEESSDRGTRKYSYDMAGNLQTITDARGIIATYSYDALNRVTMIDYPGTQEDVSLVYDNEAGCTNGLGKLCKVTDQSGVTTYSYDGFGNIAIQSRDELGVNYLTSYEYDPLGQVDLMTMPGGRTIDYSRDKLSRVIQVLVPINDISTAIVDSVTYRGDGQLASQSFGNGVIEQLAYNDKARLQTISRSSVKIVDLMSATGVALTSADIFPRSANDPFSFSAQGQGGSVGSYEYEFWHQVPGGRWTKVQAYSPENTYAFVGTSDPGQVGIHAIKVLARNQGSISPVEAEQQLSFELTSFVAIAATGVTLTSDVPTPQSAGTTITFTAQGSGGNVGSYEYEFWHYGPDTSNTWVKAQPYSSVNTFVLATSEASSVGAHIVQARVRNTGSTVTTYEAYVQTGYYNITSSTLPATGLTLTSDAPSPQAAGTTITFTAQGSGGNVGSYEYEFWHYGPDTSNTWMKAQPYSSVDTFVLATSEASSVGAHIVQARVRNTGSTVTTYEAYVQTGYYNITSSTLPATGLTLTSDVPSPQAAGTTITFTAQGSGGNVGSYEYEFWHYGPDTSNTWMKAQPYSSVDTFALATSEASSVGAHIVQARVRNTGSTVTTYEAYAQTGYYNITSSITRRSPNLNSGSSGALATNSIRSQDLGVFLKVAANDDVPGNLMVVIPDTAWKQVANSHNIWINGPATNGQWLPAGSEFNAYDAAGAVMYVDSERIDVWRRDTATGQYIHQGEHFQADVNDSGWAFHKVATSTATSLQEVTEWWTYDYDPNGNVSSIRTPYGPISFDYDSLDKLKQDNQSEGGSQSFDYDRNGNRTRMTDGVTSTTSTYLPNSNQLDTLGSSSIGHDLAGNRISDQNGARTFEYNNAGRLFKVYENGSLIATYSYNYQGQRTRKVTTSGTTVYHYDLNGSLISETDELGAPVKDIVYRNTIPIAQIDVGLTSEFITYLHSDHLGTPRRGTDENGIVVWNWDSDAFGAAAANDDSDGDGVSTIVNLRFPGQYYDQETRLHYNYFRYYDPATGRYLTSDPIGLGGGLNTYGYVGANPTGQTDRLGLCPLCLLPPAVDALGSAAITVAGAMGIGAGIESISDAAQSSNDSANDQADESSPEQCNDENNNDCEQRYSQINRIVNQLARRSRQLRENRGNLPLTGPFSVGTHQQQFRDRQRQLRRMLNEANSRGCSYYRTDAWSWATMSTPSPR